MVFYGVFALCLLLHPGWRIGGVAIAFSILVLTALSLSGTKYASQLHFIGNVRLMEFWLGMVAGRMYAAGLLRMPLPVSLSLFMLGCWALLLGTPMFRSDGAQWNRVLFGCTIPAVCVLVGTVSSEDALTRCRLNAVSVIGNSSYSIYLSQVFFLGAARMSWSALDHGTAVSPLKAVGFAIYSVFLVMIGGLTVYRCVERPLHRTLKEWYLRYRTEHHGAVG
jgi:exopolysaccharide production protein ExoZ